VGCGILVHLPAKSGAKRFLAMPPMLPRKDQFSTGSRIQTNSPITFSYSYKNAS
jgi:hypothetical protein